MKWFGLTGGIGTGKSTVSRMFEALGAPVIDADVIARQVVEPGEPALTEVVQVFGEEVLREDGTLDRAALGRRVFGDDAARAELGAILHPAIAARTAQALDALREAGSPLAIYDAALIVENGLHMMMDGLVVVDASPAVQRQRVMDRDGLDEGAAQARIDSQLPAADKLRLATWVIDNGGSLDHTRAQVEAVWRAMRARCDLPPHP
jgi:dephospho-CoA kinase